MTEKPRKTLSIKPKAVSSAEDRSAPNQEPKAVSRGSKRIIKREQVQLTTLAKPKAKVPTKKQNKSRKTPTRKPSVAPSTIRMDNLNDALNTLVVWREQQPLALGIERQIFQWIAQKQLSASKRVVQKLLYQHTHQHSYLFKIGEGGQRLNLDGSEAGLIVHAESEYAASFLATMK